MKNCFRPLGRVDIQDYHCADFVIQAAGWAGGQQLESQNQRNGNPECQHDLVTKGNPNPNTQNDRMAQVRAFIFCSDISGQIVPFFAKRQGRREWLVFVCVPVKFRMATATVIAGLGLFSCGPALAGKTAFSCSVSGKQSLATVEVICLRFRQKIDVTLPRPSTHADTFLTGSQEDAIDIEIRILKYGSITALVTQRKRGAITIHPEQVIDIMDRPMRLQDIERLADEVAKLVEKA